MLKEEHYKQRKKIPTVFDCLTGPIPTISHAERLRKAPKNKNRLGRLFKKKKQKFKKWGYKTYIKSKSWRRKKAEYYQQFGKVCAVCGDKKGLNVHHKSYVNLGHEPLEELIALCRTHHVGFHEAYGVQHNMIKNTDKFVIEQQEIDEFASLTRNF